MPSCKTEAAPCKGCLCYSVGQTENLQAILQISMIEYSGTTELPSAAPHIFCSIRKISFQHGMAGAEPLRHAQVFAAERDGAIEKPDQSSGFKEREMNMFSEKSGDPRWKLVRKGTAPAFAPRT